MQPIARRPLIRARGGLVGVHGIGHYVIARCGVIQQTSAGADENRAPGSEHAG